MARYLTDHRRFAALAVATTALCALPSAAPAAEADDGGGKKIVTKEMEWLRARPRDGLHFGGPLVSRRSVPVTGHISTARSVVTEEDYGLNVLDARTHAPVSVERKVRIRLPERVFKAYDANRVRIKLRVKVTGPRAAAPTGDARNLWQDPKPLPTTTWSCRAKLAPSRQTDREPRNFSVSSGQLTEGVRNALGLPADEMSVFPDKDEIAAEYDHEDDQAYARDLISPGATTIDTPAITWSRDHAGRSIAFTYGLSCELANHDRDISDPPFVRPVSTMPKIPNPTGADPHIDAYWTRLYDNRNFLPFPVTKCNGHDIREPFLALDKYSHLCNEQVELDEIQEEELERAILPWYDRGWYEYAAWQRSRRTAQMLAGAHGTVFLQLQHPTGDGNWRTPAQDADGDGWYRLDHEILQKTGVVGITSDEQDAINRDTVVVEADRKEVDASSLFDNANNGDSTDSGTSEDVTYKPGFDIRWLPPYREPNDTEWPDWRAPSMSAYAKRLKALEENKHTGFLETKMPSKTKPEPVRETQRYLDATNLQPMKGPSSNKREAYRILATSELMIPDDAKPGRYTFAIAAHGAPGKPADDADTNYWSKNCRIRLAIGQKTVIKRHVHMIQGGGVLTAGHMELQPGKRYPVRFDSACRQDTLDTASTGRFFDWHNYNVRLLIKEPEARELHGANDAGWFRIDVAQNENENENETGQDGDTSDDGSSNGDDADTSQDGRDRKAEKDNSGEGDAPKNTSDKDAKDEGPSLGEALGADDGGSN